MTVKVAGQSAYGVQRAWEKPEHTLSEAARVAGDNSHRATPQMGGERTNNVGNGMLAQVRRPELAFQAELLPVCVCVCVCACGVWCVVCVDEHGDVDCVCVCVCVCVCKR